MSNKIQEARDLAGMTQDELAEKSGVSRTLINGLETGRVTNTTTETLKKIAAALGKTVGEIFFA